MKYPSLLRKSTLLAVLTTTSFVQAATPTLEELWSVIQAQQKQIAQLKAKAVETEEKVEATGEMLEQRVASSSNYNSEHSSGGHASSGKTTIGGYGELHYNRLNNEKSGGSDRNEIDLHRAILFVGHEFSDKIRFWSELEVEHAQAGDGKSGGEVSMEQAYLEFDLNENLSSRAGVLLVPAGILNETHEPNTFYGVERNPVENKIIPTTWREGGASLNGRFGEGWSFDLMAHSGFNTNAGKNYAVRNGRQSVRESTADDLAYTGRVKWTGIPGVELAMTAQYQTDMTQSSDANAGSATLIETHVIANRGPFGLRALYATWDLNGSGPKSVGADEQTGWYIEPSFKITPKVGVFARYNVWDNQAGNSTDTEFKQVDIGVNYWPHPDVVIKADYQNQDSPTGQNEFDGFNVGVGYQF